MSARRITQDLTLWAADRPDCPLAAVLSYDAADPCAVRLAFVQGHRETVVYGFARDLLADGLHGPAGQCDVIVGPHEHGTHLVVVLRPEYGYPFVVYALRDQVEDFVDRMYRLVPMGCERVDVDAWIERILGEVAS
ncbi:SsgA family sporulation/cell division regulator [Streptosporangium pseudovulgare]|uniref:Sporulation-specific cell division protein SsgB n=1 Tax=Streptosporangium pseudovulgare TaxID=35765 RepID=A0ABQ2QTX3_9ACTN|nr:SsgA family sporulation/cell division regulator [Streptosporangium pseudovulgare]GGP97394.1 sporulation-specific cell division protein SsgB [Streptosporangium pseudovulgare]